MMKIDETIVERMNSSTEHLAPNTRTHSQIEGLERELPYRPCDVPRPCYYMLRLLGVWQPPGSNIIARIYTKCIWLLWALIIAAIFLQFRITQHKFTVSTTLNNIGTIVDFCCPLLFLRYYFKYGNFEHMVSHVYEISDVEGHKSMKNTRHIYSSISIFMWAISSTFFTFHWLPFWHKQWHWIVYLSVIIFTMGWWSVWFSLYGFVCHVHRNQVLVYRKHMIATLTQDINQPAEATEQNFEPSNDEKKPIGHLLFEFNDLQNWLDRTQSDFSIIISIAVAYHIYDIFVFSFAYFSKGFGAGYPIGEFIGTIIYDLISILIKLYPAAVVCQAIHKTVVTAGDMCVLGQSKKIPYARFEFYQHLSYREQDMGLRILGVKITLQLMIGVFLTVGTGLMGFLRLIIPDGDI